MKILKRIMLMFFLMLLGSFASLIAGTYTIYKSVKN